MVVKQKQSKPKASSQSTNQDATIEALNDLQAWIDDWQSLFGINAQTIATMEKNWTPKKWTARYTAKAELLEIQDYILKLEGKKLPAWQIIDLALEQLANDIGAHYGLEEED